LRHPIPDGLSGRFKLAGEVGRITAGVDQIHHLSAELSSVGRTGLGHDGTPDAKASSVSTKPNRGNPNPELGPIIMPEVKLGKVAVQVGLADVLMDAVNAALQDRDVVFRLGPSSLISPMQS
jgi:hypothetical protein